MPQADLVLEGGGMKGIGLLGAVLRLLRGGYEFPRVAGTSAGAIVAAFLAAGADEERLADIMDRLEYARVPDRAPPGIPGLSEGVSLLRDAGAYEGDYIHDFIETELATLGVTTFDHLRRKDSGADKGLDEYRRYKLVVMATDVTRGRLLRLPWDYPLLGLDPDRQRVADAVRASISIPLYFEPVTIRDGGGEPTTLVDGGVLSNFPIEAFDRTDGAEPRWPTLGVKVIPELPAGSAQLLPRIPRIASLGAAPAADAGTGRRHGDRRQRPDVCRAPLCSPAGDPGRHRRGRHRRVRRPGGDARRGARTRRRGRREVPERLGLGRLQARLPRGESVAPATRRHHDGFETQCDSTPRCSPRRTRC